MHCFGHQDKNQRCVLGYRKSAVSKCLLLWIPGYIKTASTVNEINIAMCEVYDPPIVAWDSRRFKGNSINRFPNSFAQSQSSNP